MLCLYDTVTPGKHSYHLKKKMLQAINIFFHYSKYSLLEYLRQAVEFRIEGFRFYKKKTIRVF